VDGAVGHDGLLGVHTFFCDLGPRCLSVWTKVSRRRAVSAARSHFEKGLAMKTKLVGVIGAVGVLAIVGTAAAAGSIFRFSGVTIQELQFTGEGTRIIPVGSIQNPMGCGVADFYEPTPLAAPDREAFDKALASALLAGRKIDVSLQGCGVNNRPGYVKVHLTKDQ
jgi:hypothetical protein